MTEQSGVMAAHLGAAVCPITLQLLLDAGTPLTAKDANKQTVLHHAARSGQAESLALILPLWVQSGAVGRTSAPLKGGVLDWRDRWHRTAVTWAVLNGHVQALEVLCQHGADPDPQPPSLHKHSKRTTLKQESHMEIATRLYGAGGGEIGAVLERWRGSA